MHPSSIACNTKDNMTAHMTLLVPKGGMEWAEEILQRPDHMSDGGTDMGDTEVADTLARTLQLVRAHAAAIAVGPILFHVGGEEDGVRRATPLHSTPFRDASIGDCGDWSFAQLGDRFFLLDYLKDAAATVIQKHCRGRQARTALLRRVAAATVVQKHFAGWKVRMATAFNPETRLGAYYAMREFRALI